MNDDGGTLIIMPGALGVVEIATPMIERLVAAANHPETYLLTAPAYAPLFAHHPRLRTAAFPRKGWGVMHTALDWIRRQRFHAVFDLKSNERTALLVWASGAVRRVGMGDWRVRLMYTEYLYAPATHVDNTHAVQRYNELLAFIGLPAAAQRPVLHTSDAEQHRVAAWLEARNLRSGEVVLMHAGGSHRWQSKRWKAEYYIQLAEALAQCGLPTLWLGGADEAELNHSLAQHTGIDATDHFTLLELRVLASHARCAVVNDSGPMHILAAANIPVCAFFGPTDARLSHAVGQQGRVLTHPVPCSPCHLPVCPPLREHACLRDVTPHQVVERLRAEGVLKGDY